MRCRIISGAAGAGENCVCAALQQPSDTVRRFLCCRANTDKPERLGTWMLSEVPFACLMAASSRRRRSALAKRGDAAGIEVAECRGDIIPRNVAGRHCPVGVCAWAAIEPATGMVVPIDLETREYAETQSFVLSSCEGTGLGARCLPTENLTSEFASRQFLPHTCLHLR